MQKIEDRALAAMLEMEAATGLLRRSTHFALF